MKLRKMAAVILALVIAFNTLTASAASSNDGVKLAVSADAETVTVTLSAVTAIAGFGGVDFYFTYDHEAFAFISEQDDLNGTYNSDEDFFSSGSKKDFSADSVILTIVLSVEEGYAAGENYSFTISFEEAFDSNGNDYDWNKDVLTETLHEHLWGQPEYFWSDDNSEVTATRTCKDSTHVETETVQTVSVVTKAATCLERGETTYTASFKNEAFETQEKTVANIDAIGHEWSEPTYEWAADNGSVTATRICANDNTHVETETAKTVSAVTKEATCLEKGETTYTATFENEAFETQEKTVANIDAIGHEWTFVNFVWTGNDEDGYTAAEANFVCSHDKTHTEKVTATVTAADGSGEDEGYTVYTAEAIGPDGKSYTETKKVIKKYTVTWKNYDGSVLAVTENVPYGTTPVYDGATPEKAASDQNVYEFIGWDPEITAVNADVTYTAVFKTLYKLTILDYTKGIDKNTGLPVGGIAEIKLNGEAFSTESGYAGNTTLTVDFTQSCAVAVMNEDGSYTRLASADVSTGVYTVTVEDAMTLVIVIKGDANIDGVINGKDTSRVSQAAAHTMTLSALETLAADVNADGVLNGKDTSFVSQTAAHTRVLEW